MTSDGAEVYAREAFRSFPKLLTLVDRNRLSPTYGCFDRQHWHYKTADFPAGMAETGSLPLALAATHRFPGGEGYHGHARLAELAVAGVRFAARSAHRDGSCDDYFPYERALGATAFSLYTLAETCRLLAVDDADLLAFLARRADWLLAHDESGRLANHQALCALALLTTARLTGQARFEAGAARRVERVLGWQTGEGWFWEYEGADPGYQTATIDFLAKYMTLSGDRALLAPLARAVDFCRYFVHPDGSYGGGYGSRNTYNVFPAGFEILATDVPAAAAVAAALRRGMAAGRRAYADDDRIFFHWVWDDLQAYLHHRPLAGPPPSLGARTRHFTEARLYVRDDPGRYAVVSLAKGGVLSVFDAERRVYSDHGLVGRLDDGRIVVTQLVDDYATRVEGDTVTVEGRFGYARRLQPTPWRQIAFRVFTLTVGRLASDLVRRVLQRLLIVGKRRAPLAFRRTLRFTRPMTVVDEVWWDGDAGGRRLTQLYAGSDHTAIYVATSQVFQESALQPWHDYGPYLTALATEGCLRVERTLE
jgi:hypothetical protein